MRRVNTRSQARWTLLSLLLVSTMNAASADPVLITAVQKQDRATLQQLIEQKVDVNAPQADGATALHWAVHLSDLETVRLLIEAGSDVNVKNDFGVMPLTLASENGNAFIIDALLTAGADVNAPLLTGETPLMTAAYAGDVDTVGILLKHGANVNAKEPVREQTALMWAVGEKHPDVARALVEHGADINAVTKLGFTPLLFAAREGDLESAKLLLDKGVDVNKSVGEEGETGEAVDLSGHQDSSKLSALHVAVQRGHGDLAALLLDRGADPNYDVPGWTPLHWAVGTWETEMNGANGMTAPKGHEWDALRGVQEGKFELVKTLLEHGANPNAKLQATPARYGFTVTKQPKGSTPLGLAAFAGEGDIRRLLAEHGADMAISIESGKAPLLIAAGVDRSLSERAVSEEALLTAVQAAIELGANVNDTDSKGNTALHGAVSLRSIIIVQYLADAGGDVNAKDKEGRTPVNMAQYGRGEDLTKTPLAVLLRELSIPPALRDSMDQWEDTPEHVRNAVQALLTGKLHKRDEEGKEE